MAKKQQKAAPEARHYDIVLAPHITEKSTMLSETNAVVFRVAHTATKGSMSRELVLSPTAYCVSMMGSRR